MTAIAASTCACGLSSVPGGEGPTWISAITAPPRSRSSSLLRAVHRLDHVVVGPLAQLRAPLGDASGDVLLGQADVGPHLPDAAVLEERLRQPDGAYRHVAVPVLQRLGERRARAPGPA